MPGHPLEGSQVLGQVLKIAPAGFRNLPLPWQLLLGSSRGYQVLGKPLAQHGLELHQGFMTKAGPFFHFFDSQHRHLVQGHQFPMNQGVVGPGREPQLPNGVPGKFGQLILGKLPGNSPGSPAFLFQGCQINFTRQNILPDAFNFFQGFTAGILLNRNPFRGCGQ